jgi:hypothetical protein
MRTPLASPRLVAVSGLVLQVGGRDRFTARASLSCAPLAELDADHLRVLAAFAEARTVEDVQDDLNPELDEAEVELRVDALLGWGLLRFEGLGHGVAGGFGRIGAHLPMVADAARVHAYAETIAVHAPGRRVAELGCGSGILSALASKAGARSVWAVDETDIVEVARPFLAANNVTNVIIEQGSSYVMGPPEPVELLIHELFGTDPLEEGVLQSIRDARDRWLAPGGRLLPLGFTLRAAAYGGPDWEALPPMADRLRAALDPLGLQPGPLLPAARGGLSRRPEGGLRAPPDSARLSEVIDLLHVDLMDDRALTEGELRAPLTVRRAGELRAMLVWFEVELDEERRLSTDPAGPTTHWGWQVYDLPYVLNAKQGDVWSLRFRLRTRDGLEALELLELHPSRA